MKSHSTEQTLKLLKEQKIITSSELAKKLGVSWNTADKWLLELVIEGKVERIKKVGVTLWVLK
ncbi:MAG: GntR family transcriptional regulator [Nanoarchaeota archaeon]|nr:GntR family transcriptional regulator [Nanoarchaeota archaeon]